MSLKSLVERRRLKGVIVLCWVEGSEARWRWTAEDGSRGFFWRQGGIFEWYGRGRSIRLVVLFGKESWIRECN